MNGQGYEKQDLHDIDKSRKVGVNVTVYPNVTYTKRDEKGNAIYIDGRKENEQGAVYKVGVNYAETDKARDVLSTVGSNVQINQDIAGVNRDTNRQVGEFEGREISPINVDLGTEYWLTRAGRGKAKDIFEDAGRSVEGIKRILTTRDADGNLQILKSIEAETAVQKMMRIGFIETKGKTQQQVKKELEERFGSLTKKGVKVHFYGTEDIDTTKMDDNTLAKLTANGFAITKDGTVWINKEYVDSGKVIDFNKTTQHEISHLIFGEDSEYQAQYLTRAYGEFLEGIRDNGYLKDGQGIIDYKFSMLTDEDRLRLDGYAYKDMQFIQEMADGIRAAKERLSKCGTNQKCIADNKQIIHNLEVSLKKFGVQEKIQTHKEKGKRINANKPRNIIGKIQKEIEKYKNKKEISKYEKEYQDLDEEFDEELKYVVRDLERQINQGKKKEANKKLKEIAKEIVSKNEIVLSSDYMFNNGIKTEANGKVILYAGGKDYEKLNKILKEEGILSRITVNYMEKRGADILEKVGRAAAKENKIPNYLRKSDIQQLEEYNGRKKEIFEGRKLYGRGEITESELKKYESTLNYIGASNAITDVAKIGSVVYLSSKYGINTKPEYMKQREILINDGTSTGTVRAKQITVGNRDIVQTKISLETGETLVTTKFKPTGEVLQELRFEAKGTGNVIPYSVGEATKSVLQISDSVNKTFGNMSLANTTKSAVSSNNLLTEYGNIPVVYQQPNPTLLGTMIQINPDRYIQNVTAPINYNHVFNLEINRRGKVVGGHTAFGNVTVEKVIQTYPTGVYKAEIFMQDPNNPSNLLKKSNNDGISTMFPKDWTPNRIKFEVDFAYKNRKAHSDINKALRGMWEGITPSGVWVEGYTNRNTTVYPQPK